MSRDPGTSRLRVPFLATLAILALIWGATRQSAPVRADEDAVPARAWNEKNRKNWKKPEANELRKKLSDLQYRVTQEDATEAPFRNAYWDNREHGLYVDVVSGEPLFSSLDKYKSGTGWPSFTRSLVELVETTDHKLGYPRTEIRSPIADSHLGHLFPDGPAPTGDRYCINSASLRFVPAADLVARGYGAYAEAFREAGIEVASAPAGAAPEVAEEGTEIAILAGGCYWGMEDLIRDLPGVLDTEVGFSGGTTSNPRYEEIRGSNSGHAESIRVVFDPEKLSYAELLDFFFRIHDPTTENRQGNDRGAQYRSAIFVRDDEQRETAERVKSEWDASGRWKRPIVTEIAAAGPFWPAKESHQDYLEKVPNGYTCHFLREWDE